MFERPKGSGIWWSRYLGSDGRIHREKAGTWAAARDLYIKRKKEALEGKKLPEKPRRATVSFSEIAEDCLAYSKTYKRSYRDDAYRMKQLLDCFGSCAAESIKPQEIERALTDARGQTSGCPAL